MEKAAEFYFEQTIQGTLYGKANSRRIVPVKGRHLIIKQSGALEFEKAFLAQCRRPPEPYEGPVSISAMVYYPNRRQDLEIELLKDCIEKAGIIKNDKQIIVYDKIKRGLDKENPRVEFSLRACEGY